MLIPLVRNFTFKETINNLRHSKKNKYCKQKSRKMMTVKTYTNNLGHREILKINSESLKCTKNISPTKAKIQSDF